MRNSPRRSILAILLALGLLAAMTSVALAATEAKKDAKTDAPFEKFHAIVDAAFVKKNIKVPHDENILIIDSRPYETQYVKGHIPTAVSIPDSKFDSMVDKLPKNKDALLIFYCGGLKCPLSHKSAMKAEKLGYKNVKVFAEGFPGWTKAGNYPAVPIEYVKDKVAANENYMLIDARPMNKILEGTIPTAAAIPDSQFDKKKGLLPADKSVELIYFCGGFHCPLSHKSAVKAMKLGYKNVVVAEAGYPAWKENYGGGEAAAITAGKVEGAIDVEQFKKIIAEKPESIMLIDVRDPKEFEAGHFPSAVNIPTDKLEKELASLPTDKPIVFVCNTGARSGEAFYMVMDGRKDIKDVYYLEAETTYKKDGTVDIKPNK